MQTKTFFGDVVGDRAFEEKSYKLTECTLAELKKYLIDRNADRNQPTE